ncbi:MAG: S-layer homology domain-containing protein, partial [Nitrospirota bacterium]
HADGYPQFIDNTFVKQDNYANYRTIRSDYLYYPSTGNFIGNRFENSASMDSIDLQFNSTAKKEIKASWHLDVNVKNASGSPLSGATVVVKDSAGSVVYNGFTNSGGSIRTDVFQLLDTNVSGSTVVSREIRTSKTPHTIVVTRDGLTSTRTVAITGNQTIDIVLGAPAPVPAPTPAPVPAPTPVSEPTPATGLTFTDLDPNHWTTAYIKAIAEKGITTGCAPDKYCPYNNITRAQMAVMIVRAKFGENFTYTQTPYFSDVPSTSFFFKYVQKLKDAGITQSSGTFGANDLLTRDAMAAFIVAAKYGSAFIYPQTPYFSDVPSTNYFFKYVQKLKETGITKASGTYNPQGNITRSEIAVFLARAFLGMQ